MRKTIFQCLIWTSTEHIDLFIYLTWLPLCDSICSLAFLFCRSQRAFWHICKVFDCPLSLYLHLKVYLFIYVKCQTWPHMVFDIWVYIDNSFLTIDNFIFSSMLITDILIDPEHALNQLNDHKVQTDTYCNCYKYQICKLTSYFVFVKSIGHHILLYL
jgi:hypothetical protein